MSAANPQDEARWYCVRLQPRREHVAAAHLQRLREVEVYCPQIRIKRSGRGSVSWVTEALFPGYLFARFRFAQWHRDVHYAHGVSHIVRFGQMYPNVPEAWMADLHQQFGVEPVKEVTPPLSVGSEVKIVGGPFGGLASVVTQLRAGAQRGRVLLDLLGQTVEAELPTERVLPETVHPMAMRC